MSDIQFNNISFDMPKTQSNNIKVIGVGGGGSNAVNHMFTQDIKGVDFIICNTDAQALQNSPVPNKIQLGASLTSGLGAGANPEVGEKAAEESMEEIKKMLTDQTKMVFITAGMGGGTGTGAAPIIARIAKEMNILTVGIVTMPFQYEGRMRLKQAQKGIDDLRNNVDSLIVINNNKLREVYGNLGFKAGYSKADEVLSIAARGIAEVITHHYKQNIDLHDAKTVLSNSGTAIMGSAKESGENRALGAITKALDSPLLNDNKITGAKNVLLLIVFGTEEITIDEIGEINDYIQQEAGFDANIIMGVGEDESLEDAISVTVVATGFAQDQQFDITNTEVKKIYHTLNAEQTAKYTFDENQSLQKQTFETVIESVATEPKVVHQLIEDDIIEDTIKPIETAFNEEDSQKKNQSIDENDFVIKDVTPNLFSQVIEGSIDEPNIFELPVYGSEEVKSTNFTTPTTPKVVIEPVAIQNTVANRQLGFYNLTSLGNKPNINEIEVVGAMEFKRVENTAVEPKVTRYVLEDFDIEPTIQNTSVRQNNPINAIEEDESLSGITFEVRAETSSAPTEEENQNPTKAELQKTADKRKKSFYNYNHKKNQASYITNEAYVNEFEKVPAYKRQGIQVENATDSNQISRTSINFDENNEVVIRKNNSFLHDNVD